MIDAVMIERLKASPTSAKCDVVLKLVKQVADKAGVSAGQRAVNNMARYVSNLFLVNRPLTDPKDTRTLESLLVPMRSFCPNIVAVLEAVYSETAILLFLIRLSEELKEELRIQAKT